MSDSEDISDFESNDTNSYSMSGISEDDDMFKEVEITAQLQNDIDHIQHFFGQGTIDIKGPIIDTVDLTLYVTDIPLSHQTAKAWNVNLDEPIVISLKGISATGYLHSYAPKVEVYQSQQMGIQSQLTFIVGQFCKKQFDKHANEYTSSQTPCNVNAPESQLESELLEMGFSANQSYVASRECDNIQQAIQYLIDNPNPRKSRRLRKSKPGPKKKAHVQSGSDDFIPNYDNGLLCEIIRYVTYRIPTLNKYCVICDKTHLFAQSLLKPAVCRRELCAFTYQQFNIVSDADLATHAEVVDLLVSMAKAAANSNRRHQILNPFPTVFDPESSQQQIVLDPDQPDYDMASDMLNKLPVPINDSVHRNPLSFSLLQWIVNSNRTHLVKLPNEFHIKAMDTPFQYIMLSAPPEKEERFQQLKQTYGSKFAFHGSRVENWYSIVRNGLKNASGTKLQLNGAAHGQGIYLANHASTSFGYSLGMCNYNNQYSSASDNNNTDEYGIQDGKWICMALCEVAMSDTIKKSGAIWVVPDENCVVTRFFFVYKDGRYSTRASGAVTTNTTFMSQVKAAMKCLE
jgi:poly [ADP-ribose] polymerase 6/8